MEPIHATDHYNILQPPDGSFLIVPRDRHAREVLADILGELQFDTRSVPIHDDGSYAIRRDNPFGLVHLTERCEARITLAEARRVLNAGEPAERPAPFRTHRMNTKDRLQALQAEAGMQHIHFEKLKRRRASVSKAVNATIVLAALATAAASAAEMPAAAIVTFSATLLIAITLNLYVTDTQEDRNLHILGDQWQHHQTNAARLLHAMQDANKDGQRTREDAEMLERRMILTRAEALRYQPLPGPAEPPAPCTRTGTGATLEGDRGNRRVAGRPVGERRP